MEKERDRKDTENRFPDVSLRKVLGLVLPDHRINYCCLSWATATILAWRNPSRKTAVSLNPLASSSMPASLPLCESNFKEKGAESKTGGGLEEKMKGNWNEKKSSVQRGGRHQAGWEH